ncbi:MAG: FAD:protein FMN transferase [Gammaproteobacteria bacterium]|nr:FAD:protein FMN transferase [Gammaproteobacteria bacterium]
MRTTRLAMLAACVVLASCSGVDNGAESFSGAALGTAWSVKVTDLRRDLSRTIFEERITERIAAVDAAMSTYRNDSELMQFNDYPSTDWFPVSRSVAAVVAEAIAISQLSRGAFDTTIQPLTELWGFGASGVRSRPPERSEVRQARSQTGNQKLQVRLNPPALRKTASEIAVDLSGIAKGFAVDQVAALLDEHGSRNYLVEIGGELRAMGHNAQFKPWRIGVELPDPDATEFERIMPLQNQGMATSGDYRNFFEDMGRRYSHTIDPRTGYPIRHNLAAVTVLADSAMRADALATALLVMGLQDGRALAKRENIAAIFIQRRDGRFESTDSPAMQRYLGGFE